MKKLKLGDYKMLSKEQMRSVSGGYAGDYFTGWICSCSGGNFQTCMNDWDSMIGGRCNTWCSSHCYTDPHHYLNVWGLCAY
jgi:natural product precursor